MKKITKPMTAIERFCKRVKKDHDVDLDPTTFRRTYAGYWQRAQGAWSWSMEVVVRSGTVGSQWPIWQLLTAPVLDFDGECFYPEDKKDE